LGENYLNTMVEAVAKYSGGKIGVLMLVIGFGLVFGVDGSDRAKTFTGKSDYWPEASYHGYMDVDTPDGSMFYWYFPSRGNPETDPWALWLTGGPGCSSEIALFRENGPFHIDEKTLKLSTNEFSWNSRANLIFIDSPLGAGLSIPDSLKDFPRTETQIARNIYTFLTKFQDHFPLFVGKNFYLTGESYAGHYLPNLASYL
jgi:carboxypeptidase C (cathepsin A)